MEKVRKKGGMKISPALEFTEKGWKDGGKSTAKGGQKCGSCTARRKLHLKVNHQLHQSFMIFIFDFAYKKLVHSKG